MSKYLAIAIAAVVERIAIVLVVVAAVLIGAVVLIVRFS